jgi:NAD(P)-dependent dehydrogenase (short-subunit alcohol dehydrogenase family)
MMGRLEGKVAIVIGAGQTSGETVGNGRATALRFAEEGAKILAVDRDLESAQETVSIAKGSGETLAVQADVANSESIREAIEAAYTRWGRIDILHYNVGIAKAGGDRELEDLTDEIFDRVNTINLRGAVMAAKHVIPIMRKQQSGVIINVASTAAIETTGSTVTYRTSKAGMLAFTQQLAFLNAPFGVRANSILPGLMDTPMAVDQRSRLWNRSREDIAAERNSKVPLRGRMGTGWDVANAAVFLASDEAGFVTGVSLPVDGGLLLRIGA